MEHDESEDLLGGDSLNLHLLIAAVLAARDLNSAPRDVQTIGQQVPQLIVGLVIDRRRCQANAQRAFPLAGDFAAAGAWRRVFCCCRDWNGAV